MLIGLRDISNTRFQLYLPYSVELKNDWRVTVGDGLAWAWKEVVVACLRRDTKICLSGLEEVAKTSVKIAGLRAEIWTRYLQVRSWSGKQWAATFGFTKQWVLHSDGSLFFWGGGLIINHFV